MKKIINILFLILLAGCKTPNQSLNEYDIKVLKEYVKKECNEQLSLMPQDYLEYELQVKSSEIKRELYQIKENVYLKMSIGNDSKMYLEPGKYELRFIYENLEYKIKIEMIDTIPPEIIYTEQRTFVTGSQPVDVAAFVDYIDFSKTTIKVEGEIQFDVAGCYPITFTAVDACGNKTVETIDFEVIDSDDLIQTME